MLRAKKIKQERVISNVVKEGINTSYTVAREGLTENGSSEQSPKGNKRGKQVDIWGKSIPDRGRSMPGELEEKQKPMWCSSLKDK